MEGVDTGFCRSHTRISNSLRAFATRLFFMAYKSFYLGAPAYRGEAGRGLAPRTWHPAKCHLFGMHSY